MEKTKYLLSLLILLTFSCKRIAKKGEIIKNIEKNNTCFTGNYKIQILNSIFESDYILRHMDPRVKKSETNLKILESDFLSDVPSMTFRNQNVHFIDSLNLTDDTYRLTVSKIDCEEKSLSFLVLYPIEGHWYAEGRVYHVGGKLETEITAGGVSD